MESTNVTLRQRLIGIAIALVLIVGACLIPGSEALGREGIITLGALLALAVLWATSALPIGIIALLIPVLLIVLGAADAKSVFSGYAATPLFFIVAVFALPVIMQKTKWGLRLINVLLKWTGSDSRKLVLGFMIATTLVSTVMSDVPTTVLFLGFALTILKAAGAKRALPLKVGGAFHSPLMQPAKDELQAAIEQTVFSAPKCPVYQNVDGKPHTDAEEIKANLIAQLTSSVRWTSSVQNMIADGADDFTECGPGKALQGMIGRIDKNVKVAGIQ